MSDKRKSHCRQGHEFTPENTYTSSSKQRQCRACAHRRASDWNATNPEKRRKITRRYRANKAARMKARDS